MVKYFIILLAFTVSCASGDCRQKKTNKDFVELVANLPEFQNKKTKEISRSDLKLIQVFIADGSKQCVADSQIPIETYKKQLEEARVKVIKVSHKSDGMMRIQSCGSDTGMIYVFDIQNVDLKKAQSLGFKLHKPSI